MCIDVARRLLRRLGFDNEIIIVCADVAWQLTTGNLTVTCTMQCSIIFGRVSGNESLLWKSQNESSMVS